MVTFAVVRNSNHKQEHHSTLFSLPSAMARWQISVSSCIADLHWDNASSVCDPKIRFVTRRTLAEHYVSFGNVHSLDR